MTVIVFYFWDGQKLETTCHSTISEGSNGVISHEGAELQPVHQRHSMSGAKMGLMEYFRAIWGCKGVIDSYR